MNNLSFDFKLATGVSRSNGESILVQRELVFDKIGSYQPLTDVRDYAVIDKDVALIEKLMRGAQLEEATQVYEQGAFSRSYAELTIGSQGLPGDIQFHSLVTGASDSGEVIKGTLLGHGKLGDKVVRILYYNSENSQSSCYVGGNPEPILGGCFTASGQMMFDVLNETAPYTYEERSSNKNDRTLASFSTDAQNEMRPCPKCELYTDFFRFFQFYGQYDYANQWIMAALTGARTVFDSATADFKSLSLEARSAAALKAMVTMSMVPYIVREMEEAIKQCKIQCPKEGCTDNALNDVDGAAALYFGSLDDGSGAGKLMDSVANLECQEFKTCGINGDKTKGTAKASIEIMHEFQATQTNLTARACQEARAHKDHVTKWMKVPLIQGALRYAYLRSNGKATDVDIANGAAYAASIAPWVAACSFKDAVIINDNMETMAKTTDFSMVKSAFERHYACLGVKCREIGGYWNPAKSAYYKGADECTFDVVKSEDPKKRAIGWGVGLPLFVMAAVVIALRRRKSKAKRKNNKSPGANNLEDDISDSSDDSEGDLRFT